MSQDGDVDAPDMEMSYSNMESEVGPALRYKVLWTEQKVFSYFEVSGYCGRGCHLMFRWCLSDSDVGIQYGCWARGLILQHINFRILGYGSECKFVDTGAGIWLINIYSGI